MKMEFQKIVLDDLITYARKDEHSILISGLSGTGKTYLAKEYYSLIGADDFIVINPVVKDIREIIDAIYNIDSKIVVCVENLDSGVKASSHTILKFLEEPLSNVYVIITCRSTYGVPDTILSRSKQLVLGHPLQQDIDDYARLKDSIKYTRLKESNVYRSCTSFNDIDYLFTLTLDQLSYIESFNDSISFKKPILDNSWKLNHFEDNSNLDSKFLLKYMLYCSKDVSLKSKILKCLSGLENYPISEHAILSQFLLEVKYGE